LKIFQKIFFSQNFPIFFRIIKFEKYKKKKMANHYHTQFQPANSKHRKMVQFNDMPFVASSSNNNVNILKSRSDGLEYPSQKILQNNPQNPPEFIFKKPKQTVNYVQQTCVRYLRPTTPEHLSPPGDIVIRQMADVTERSLPPLLIRQRPSSSGSGVESRQKLSGVASQTLSKEKLIIREAPPTLPSSLLSSSENQVIMVSKSLNSPPLQQPQPAQRKLIIYRQAPVPNKPPPIIVERWLPYGKIKRKVIFQKADGTSVTATTMTAPIHTTTTNTLNKSPSVSTTTTTTVTTTDPDCLFTTLAQRIFSFIDKANSGYIPVKDATVLYERFKDRLNMHAKAAAATTTSTSTKTTDDSLIHTCDYDDGEKTMPNFRNEKEGLVSFDEFKRCFLDYYNSENY
jgi:hypothetical protein